VAYCHCSDCRGYTGAPVVAWAAFETEKVCFIKGECKIHESSPGRSWGFCDQCGTSLTWEGESFGKIITEFHISTLDNPEKFVPDRHWYDCERIPWFDVADNLPRYHIFDYGDKEPTHHGPK
jgi:adenylate cyclase